MKHTTQTIQVPALWNATSKLFAALRIVNSWLADNANNRQKRGQEYRAIRQLHALDEHLLKDIGLHRSQIESAVLTGRVDANRSYWSMR